MIRAEKNAKREERKRNKLQDRERGKKEKRRPSQNRRPLTPKYTSSSSASAKSDRAMYEETMSLLHLVASDFDEETARGALLIWNDLLFLKQESLLTSLGTILYM